MSGLGAPSLDGKARARARNVGARRTHQFALLDEVVGDGRAEDRDIEHRALLDLGLERHSRVEGERELVLGRLLELRAQFFQRRLHGIRSQDLDLGRVAGAGRE
jgi:hypothetical protein